MSQVNVDTIRKSDGSAGTDIRIKNTSVHESDGGTSVTQNIVQSLIKVWTFYDVDSDGIHDSFNSASFTDNGSGDSTIAYTNNMGNVNYAPIGNCTHDSGSYGALMELAHDTTPSTSSVNFDHMQPYSASGTRVDQEMCALHISGDLA